MTSWYSPQATRIWRLPGLSSWQDESSRAARQATDEALMAIAADGFTGIWHFCQLRELMHSRVFPELNQPEAGRRLASLQMSIDRARAHGLGTWLYFNEPAGVPKDHPFWTKHRDVQGVDKWNLHGLCTSTPQVQTYFREAIESVFSRLRNVAGVVLITACENLTHCWSKINRQAGGAPPACPRCAGREPSELIGELLQTWADAGKRHQFRVMAWNWEWAYYYPDPQAPIVERLPEGVELLLDLEIGGTKAVGDRTVPVGEYSLSYVGPSPRLVSTQAIAGDRPIHAKVQLNSTHELCTVPNVPVLATLHEKLCALTRLNLAGYMGCWTIGCGQTINTFAANLFREDPEGFQDQQKFLGEVAVRYLGMGETSEVVAAWRGFSEAFAEYPFVTRLLYHGPHNDAPGRPLLLTFEGLPIRRSFMADPFGDDLENCLETLTLEEVIAAFERMTGGWETSLLLYADGVGSRQPRELGVARMIGIQLRSTLNAFRFHRERRRVLAENGLKAPCRLPRDPALLAIMHAEVANVEPALPLVAADPRLGFHEEYQGYKYNGAAIGAKLAAMRRELKG